MLVIIVAECMLSMLSMANYHSVSILVLLMNKYHYFVMRAFLLDNYSIVMVKPKVNSISKG